MTLSAESRSRLESLVSRIRSRAGAEIRSADECTYAASLADQIRWIARSRANIDSDESLAQALSDLEQQSAVPNALPGDWISQLIEASKLWRPVPYAQLSIRSAPEGLQVRIRGDKVGVTNWVKRLPPGEYRLELLANDQVVYSERLHLADHVDKTVTYPK